MKINPSQESREREDTESTKRGKSALGGRGRALAVNISDNWSVAHSRHQPRTAIRRETGEDPAAAKQ